MTTASIILAAGLGKRMHSKLPKMLHPLVGKPIILHSLKAVQNLTDLPPVVVVGHGAEQVQSVVAEATPGGVKFALQPEQLGTADAVKCAQSFLEGKADRILVTLGDMPLLREETLRQLMSLYQETGCVLTMASIVTDLSRGFGRIIRNEAGSVVAIVEEAVATPEQLGVNEFNISAYCINAEWLWSRLLQIRVSPKGEYYLTDLVELAVMEGQRVESLVLADPQEGLGINDRVDLADAEAAMRKRINTAWMLAGVTLLEPATTTIEPDVVIGQDTTIYPNTFLRGTSQIGSDCLIGPNTTLVNTQVGDHSKIVESVAEYALVGNGVCIGPYCHLRKGVILKDHVHMGNFGEVKESTLDENVKMGHFSYIGDAHIGANVNIGAGTITCNFDGEKKNFTEIGENTFIGSDTMLVAPLKIGKNAKTGAGSVVTHDVPDDTLVLGVPARAKERRENCD
ncbi:MAG: bifunctional UDP-N-acetylglucosamine diphosphorylase/glucosamine-1-phosphate N-acetyltransferase GlmU [Anaerolineaceae bacterium]